MNQGFAARPGLAIAASFLLGVFSSGCDGCGSKKPYTPFGVASTLPNLEPAPSSTPDAVTPMVVPSGFAPRKAELVPSAPATWQGSGLNLSAPDGQRFAQVLPADFDADQKLDAIAWLEPAPGQVAVPGELWYFPGEAPARKLSSLPGFVPSSLDCKSSATLTQTGVHSATLDVAATCSAPLLARAPARALLVVSPTVEHPVLLTLRVASAAPEESLDFTVDSSDQDHDGRDDVRLTTSLTHAASEAVSADLVWLDRAAGASRSASEPPASLLRLASRIGLQARGKSAARARTRVSSTLRLLSSLCAEGGVGRVFDEDGAAIRCGDLGKVIDSLGTSEVVAALAQQDTVGAFAVLTRDGWYFKKYSTAAKKAIERELLRGVTRLDLEQPLVPRAQPKLPQVPHYSPLWFESDGTLLIQGPGAISRVSISPSSEEPVPGDAGVTPWALDLALPNGQRVLGAAHACDRSELLINQSDAQHPLLPAIATQLLAARPASCAGRGAGPQVLIAPLSFDDRGLEALIAGARISTAAQGQKSCGSLPAMGTPQSADGRWLVTPTQLGLLVIGERKELWQAGKLLEHADVSAFRDCVVANGAGAVACIEAGRALLFARPKSTVSTPRH